MGAQSNPVHARAFSRTLISMSAVATEVETFESGKAPLTGSLQQVPFIGEVTEETMAAAGVKSIWQLFGKYLEFDRDDAKLAEYLRKLGVNPGNIDRVVTAFSARIRTAGIATIEVPLSESMRETSKLTGAKRTAFVNKKITKLDDLVGVADTTMKKMAAATPPVKSLDQLFGVFLSLLDEPTTKFSNAPGDAFYAKLTNYGVTGYKSTVVDCILTKLEKGLDSGD